jgi:hypothetical protein
MPIRGLAGRAGWMPGEARKHCGDSSPILRSQLQERRNICDRFAEDRLGSEGCAAKFTGDRDRFSGYPPGAVLQPRPPPANWWPPRDRNSSPGTRYRLLCQANGGEYAATAGWEPWDWSGRAAKGLKCAGFRSRRDKNLLVWWKRAKPIGAGRNKTPPGPCAEILATCFPGPK